MDAKIKLKDYCKFPNCNEDEDQNPQYIGLKIISKKKKRFEFIFPVNYYTEEELKKIENNYDFLNDIRNLLFEIYETNRSEIYNNSNATEIKECPIDSYLWIMRNYMENGYYFEKEIIYDKRNTGKINWKKTIKNNEYLVDDNYNLIYNKYIIKHNIILSANIITQIHKYCVYEAAECFGPLIGLNKKNVEEPLVELDEKTMILILKNEYSKTFLDSKKELLLNMIKLLEWKSEGIADYDMFSISVNKFETVFERLIIERFGNVSNIEEYYPFGKWHINNDIKGEEASKLREDAIIDLSDKDKEIYILDAKYYKYCYLENKNIRKLPMTSSIAKQIIYGEYLDINRRKNGIKIYNVFIIPYNKSNDKKNPEFMKYIGYADAMWKNTGKTYERIYTFSVDLRDLINNTCGSKVELINKLQKEVKTQIKRIKN